MNGRRRFLASLAALGMAAASLPARADMTKAQCIDTNGKAQDLQHDGKLTAARAALQSCAVAACPAAIRGDCAKRLDALDKTQPAVIFGVKDGSGNDVSGATVTVDGAAPITLDGTLMRVDPGEHVFVFSATGQPSVTKKLVLVEGDTARRERIVLGEATAGPSTPPTGNTDTAQVTTSEGMSTLRLAGLITGGAGVVGIGLGSVFGVLASSAWNSQKQDCASATNCANHDQAVKDHSTLSTDSTISTIGFIAGGALLAGGVVMFFLGGNNNAEQPATTTTGLMVSPSFGPGAGGMTLHGSF